MLGNPYYGSSFKQTVASVACALCSLSKHYKGRREKLLERWLHRERITTGHALSNTMQNDGLSFRIHHGGDCGTGNAAYNSKSRVEGELCREAENIATRKPAPTKSHPVTAVHDCCTRLALVSFFTLGTSHARDPWQPLRTALSTILLCRTHRNNSLFLYTRGCSLTRHAAEARLDKLECRPQFKSLKLMHIHELNLFQI